MVENGMVIYNEPKYTDGPICPECGEPCETYYFDKYGDIIGCDNCITSGDAWERMYEDEENERCLREEARYEELREISNM